MIEDHPSHIHHHHSIQTLTTLDLTKNAIGGEGVQFLANALQTNTVSELLYSSITRSPSSLNTDTHNVESWREQYRQ
jgi:hypothetical protein